MLAARESGRIIPPVFPKYATSFLRSLRCVLPKIDPTTEQVYGATAKARSRVRQDQHPRPRTHCLPNRALAEIAKRTAHVRSLALAGDWMVRSASLFGRGCGMDWKGLEPHIENLIPGVILGWLLAAQLSLGQISVLGTEPGTVSGIIFLAVCYAIGVTSAVASRFLLDLVSEKGPRSWVIHFLSHQQPRDVAPHVKSEEYDRDLKWEKQRWFQIGEVALTNAVYRAVIRTVMKASDDRAKELSRRRAQGRLVRNLFFPAAILIYSKLSWKSDLWTPVLTIRWQLIWTAGAIVLWVFMYAYAEYNVYAEAADVCFQSPNRAGPRN